MLISDQSPTRIKCSHLAKVALNAFTTGEMRTVSLIDEEDVIERILRHLGLWQEGVRVHSGTDPPGETTLDPWLDDPFPDYDTEPVVAFRDYRCPSRLICANSEDYARRRPSLHRSQQMLSDPARMRLSMTTEA